MATYIYILSFEGLLSRCNCIKISIIMTNTSKCNRAGAIKYMHTAYLKSRLIISKSKFIYNKVHSIVIYSFILFSVLVKQVAQADSTRHYTAVWSFIWSGLHVVGGKFSVSNEDSAVYDHNAGKVFSLMMKSRLKFW